MYPGNSTRSECINDCLINELKLQKVSHLNLVDRKYKIARQNYEVRKGCVRRCEMNCHSTFYLAYSTTKIVLNETKLNEKSNLTSLENRPCRHNIHLKEKKYFRLNESKSMFSLVPFIMDLSNLASVLFGFKFQSLIYKFFKKVLNKRDLDFKNLKFLSIYVGLSLALLQFIYYLNEYLKFDTVKKMKVGKNNSIEEISISICFEKSYDFIINNLNYDKDKELEFLTFFKSTIQNIQLRRQAIVSSHKGGDFDDIIFNKTRIFFKDLCICFQFQIFVDNTSSLISNFNEIFFGYFLFPKNNFYIYFKHNYQFKHFFLTKDMKLPSYMTERFYNEESFTIYQVKIVKVLCHFTFKTYLHILHISHKFNSKLL